ncbi:unnamed protein product [Rotaria sp. Silwood1]|nr:unnamed protein product [Rotaria sp. Silwood1]CAF1611918.1 unnamed protein product [Rotaria sp. Silwood1]CAF3719703.1 unnamed protein product [Rotaria sp. Silwood1]CAF3790362.1 unnamed protein product [Rotaria sp. Silwood1]CAF4757548.1 unnamed protein product [Rotaria sp. Silwood1]
MSSSHQRSTSTRPSRPTQTVGPLYVHRSASAPQRQFIFVLTNNPDLLRGTRAFQTQEWEQRRRGGMLIPNRPMHIGRAQTEEHETILYNTLRFELEECVRAYLQRTQRLYPINLVFDLSNVQPQR